MTRIPGLDPEVLADLRAREASTRDPRRTRPDGWVPPAIVEHWPCRGCGVLVGMTREAIDLHAIFNRQLVKRGDQPLTRRGLCSDCKRKDDELAAMQRPRRNS